MRQESGQWACGVALKSRFGEAYTEEAFRYFLANERRRSERSGRAFLLVLVELAEAAGESTRIDSDAGSRIFSSLWTCLRDTDCVGWYRDERIAGAVLSPVGSTPPAQMCETIAQRVRAALADAFHTRLAGRLQVRVLPVQSTLRI